MPPLLPFNEEKMTSHDKRLTQMLSAHFRNLSNVMRYPHLPSSLHAANCTPDSDSLPAMSKALLAVNPTSKLRKDGDCKFTGSWPSGLVDLELPHMAP